MLSSLELMIPVSFAEISPLTPEDRVWFFKLGERL
jgi:hypothetical protein